MNFSSSNGGAVSGQIFLQKLVYSFRRLSRGAVIKLSGKVQRQSSGRAGRPYFHLHIIPFVKNKNGIVYRVYDAILYCVLCESCRRTSVSRDFSGFSFRFSIRASAWPSSPPGIYHILGARETKFWFASFVFWLSSCFSAFSSSLLMRPAPCPDPLVASHGHEHTGVVGDDGHHAVGGGGVGVCDRHGLGVGRPCRYMRCRK